MFRTTVGGAAKLGEWLRQEPKVLPEVRTPRFGEWLLDLKEITAGLSRPTIVILIIGKTDVLEEGPRGSLQEEIVALSQKDEAVIFAEIDPIFHRGSELIGLFCHQIGDGSLEKMGEQIPELREALASL